MSEKPSDINVQIKFSASAALREALKIRAAKERREMQDLMTDALNAYLEASPAVPTEADRYCNKLRKFMGKKNLVDGEKTGLNMIVFLLDLWVKG